MNRGLAAVAAPRIIAIGVMLVVGIACWTSAAQAPPAGDERRRDGAGEVAQPAPASVDFSWRTHAGDFPKDKPGYLILCEEDIVRWSRLLPAFVAHKEAMGFRVYVATERDYAGGKAGADQRDHLAGWLGRFRQRTGVKFALFIGNQNWNSPTMPPGASATHAGAGDDSYKSAGCDIDPALGKLAVGRISCTGTQVGNSIYALDRILAKFIRYENETLAGKALDWRGHALTMISNYGHSNYDDDYRGELEKHGTTYEHWSSHWDMDFPGGNRPDLIPENRAIGFPTWSLIQGYQARAFGIVSHMSHASSYGAEGIAENTELLRFRDDRKPAAVAIVGCTAFGVVNDCHMGQAHLCNGAIAVTGDTISGNGWFRRLQFLMGLVRDRMTVGEAAPIGPALLYGDPSLRVVSPQGTPLCELAISPTLHTLYEERTCNYATPAAAIQKTYTLSNNTTTLMKVAVECDASWVRLSTTALSIPARGTAELQVSGDCNGVLPGFHVASIRFTRDDGQEYERRLAVRVVPIVDFYFPLDSVVQGKTKHRQNHVVTRDFLAGRTPSTTFVGNPVELSVEAPPAKDAKSAALIPELTLQQRHRRAMETKPGEIDFDPEGKVGGAIRFNMPATPWKLWHPSGNLAWRGFSLSWWFKPASLPSRPESPYVLVARPFALTFDALGELRLQDKPEGATTAARVGRLAVGDWSFIQVWLDADRQVYEAQVNGGEVVSIPMPFTQTGSCVEMGRFDGWLDEIKFQSGTPSPAQREHARRDAGQTQWVGSPTPSNLAFSETTPLLRWRSAFGSEPGGPTRYRVAIDESPANLAAGDTPFFSCETRETLCAPPRLEKNAIYHWRVDTVGADGVVHAGPVWSFKTLAEEPFTVLRPAREQTVSAASKAQEPGGIGQGHGITMPAPLILEFPASTLPQARGKAYLYFNTLKRRGMTGITVSGMDQGITVAPDVRRDDFERLPKATIAEFATQHPRGHWVDVTSSVVAGRPCRFVVHTNTDIHARGGGDQDGFFSPSDHVRAEPKLVFFPPTAEPEILPGTIPEQVTIADAQATVDLAGFVVRSRADAPPEFTWSNAPDWAQLSREGVISVKPGTTWSDVPFGGYDTRLTIKATGGTKTIRVPLKLVVPLPETRLKVTLGADGLVTMGPVDPQRPLAPGDIRYTVDGSPVTDESPRYEAPFKPTRGYAITARFFFRGEYPLAPVSLNDAVEVPRDGWRALEAAGDTAAVFDGKVDTSWQAEPTPLPQAFAWDLGEPRNVAEISCQSHISSPDGRIKQFTLSASADGKTWKKIHTGTLTNDPSPERIVLKTPCVARCLKLEANSLHAGKAMILSELEVLAK